MNGELAAIASFGTAALWIIGFALPVLIVLAISYFRRSRRVRGSQEGPSDRRPQPPPGDSDQGSAA